MSTEDKIAKLEAKCLGLEAVLTGHFRTIGENRKLEETLERTNNLIHHWAEVGNIMQASDFMARLGEIQDGDK